jgi:hypothetical protein
VQERTIDPEDLALWYATDSPKDAVEVIREGLKKPRAFRDRRLRQLANLGLRLRR